MVNLVILVNLLILVILVNLLILVIPSDYGESGNTGESVDSGNYGNFVDSGDSGETSYFGESGDFDEPGFISDESTTMSVESDGFDSVESITMLLSIAMLPSPVSWHSAVYVELGLKQNLLPRPGSPSIVSLMYTQLSLSTSFV